MLSFLSPIIRYGLSWLAVFQLYRCAFVLFLWQKFSQTPILEIVKSFFYGKGLDLSVIGYVSALPLLCYCIQSFLTTKIFTTKHLKIYTYTVFVFFSFLQIIDMNIYKEWGAKMDYKVINLVIQSPREAFVSTYSSPWFLSMTIFVLLIVLGAFVFHYFVFRRTRPHQKISILKKIPLTLISLATCFIAIRGGIGVAPINHSTAYFSSYPIANHAALNTEWSLLKSILDNQYGASANQYNYYANIQEAESVSINLRNTIADDGTEQILSTPHPNICLLILESFSSDFIASLGGDTNITPFIDSAIQNGLLFDNIYASGDRTYKGLPAILSAEPALGEKNIIEENNKQEKLPSLAKDLAQQNYHTYFLYGGDGMFSNIKSYVLAHQFQQYEDQKNFHPSLHTGKWGVPDHVTLTHLAQKISSFPQPFFVTYLSLSNHEPFDLPVALKFGTSNNVNKIKSTAYFTDSCLSVFWNQVTKTPQFTNTLFILIADHGTPALRGYANNFDYRKFKIPLLFFGPALRPAYKGKRNHIIGNQTDLAHTLFYQLGLPSSQYYWSKNLLQARTPSLTHYVFNNGFGVVGETDTIVFDANANREIFEKKTSTKDSILQQGKAFYQLNFQKYLTR